MCDKSNDNNNKKEWKPKNFSKDIPIIEPKPNKPIVPPVKPKE